MSQAELETRAESWKTAAFNTCTGMVAVTGYYLFPMYLTGHWHGYAALSLGIALAATVILALTWYPNLPGDRQ